MYQGDYPLESAIYWSAERGIKRPTLAQAMPEDLDGYAGPFAPFNESKGAAIKIDHSVASRVPALCLPGGPHAIFRRVRAVVVDALDAVATAWPWPHVGVERIERLAPALTDGDPAPAVVAPVSAVRVGAAISEATPCIPFRADGTLPGHAMSGPPCACLFGAQAPTARAASISKGGSVNGLFSAAVAATGPFALPRFATQYGPSAEASPCHLDERRHNVKFTMECA